MVQSRSHTLYAGMCEEPDGAAATCFVVALDADGHELWRVTLPQAGAGLAGLVADGTGDVWAQGPSLTRIDPSGAISWTGAPAALEWENTAVALAAGGTYFQYAKGPGPQLAVQAIGIQGTVRWSVPIGGHVRAGDNLSPTTLQAPSIDSAGYLEVPCQPCADGRTGIAQVDVSAGTVRTVASVPAGDARITLPADLVTCDGQGNTYFAAGPFLASFGQGGAMRWTSPVALAPALVTLNRVVALSVTMASFTLVALSPVDGTVIGTTPAADGEALVVLVAGGLRMTSAAFPVSGSSFVTTTGTAIFDGSSHLVWSDPGMDPSTAIPDVGRVYGIERDDQGHGTLVAKQAAISGLEQGPWPLLRHDPGRTGSAAGAW
ncbi:MAG: hypothetical protein ACREJ3_01345 [Polyangiaceae bacterium]